MKYIELKQQLSEELNGFPMKFAFSDEQLQEGLNELGATKDEVVSITGGGFIRKIDVDAFKAMFKEHNNRMSEAMKDKDFMIDALVYELGNHEYCITYDPEPALSALGIDVDDIDDHVRECFKEAKGIYLESCEECNA